MNALNRAVNERCDLGNSKTCDASHSGSTFWVRDHLNFLSVVAEVVDVAVAAWEVGAERLTGYAYKRGVKGGFEVDERRVPGTGNQGPMGDTVEVQAVVKPDFRTCGFAYGVNSVYKALERGRK